MARKPMKERYDEYMTRREVAMQSPMGAFQDYKRYMPPFHIWGNLYYVGDKWCSIYIVDTGDGLLMLDAGMPAGSIPLLVHTIWEAGFNPRNIKWLITAHIPIKKTVRNSCPIIMENTPVTTAAMTM